LTPRLSIAIAVHGGVERLPALLAALRPQWRSDVEVLVCHPSGCGAAEICRGAEWVTPVEAPAGSLAPELWRDGILRANAPRVALTVAHCVPGPGWIERLCAADLDTWAGIGGAIEDPPDSDARGRAVFLLRYLRYAPPFAFHEAREIPGDNAVYARLALLEHAKAFAEGFWEPEIHARLRRQGRRLALDPELRVTHRNGYGTLAFARQRIAHGRRFGRDRARPLPRSRRLLLALAAPAVPLLLGSRILRAAWQRPGGRWPLLLALPHLSLFLAAWALGEALGALDAAREGRRWRSD
jgi:hypothetical protein